MVWKSSSCLLELVFIAWKNQLSFVSNKAKSTVKLCAVVLQFLWVTDFTNIADDSLSLALSVSVSVSISAGSQQTGKTTTQLHSLICKNEFGHHSSWPSLCLNPPYASQGSSQFNHRDPSLDTQRNIQHTQCSQFIMKQIGFYLQLS